MSKRDPNSLELTQQKKPRSASEELKGNKLQKKKSGRVGEKNVNQTKKTNQALPG